MAQIGYEYGTSPRKLEPEINIKTKKQNVTNKGKLEVVKNMLKEQTDTNFISKVTGLSIEKINLIKEV